PGPKPEQTFAGKYFPMFTDNDEQIEQWNEEAARVVEAYDRYATGTSENATSIPRSYGELRGSPEGLKFSIEDSGGGGGKRTGDGFTGGTGNNSSGSTSTSGYTGGPISSNPTGISGPNGPRGPGRPGVPGGPGGPRGPR